jgi:hypothetical protein
VGGKAFRMTFAEDESRFLNVDLDVEARYDLSPLLQALGDGVFDLRTGPIAGGFETHLELSGGANYPADAETAIRELVHRLRRLPEDVRGLWTEATRRDFNIGIQGGTQGPAFEAAIAPDLLVAVAELKARIVVTVYPAHLESGEDEDT